MLNRYLDRAKSLAGQKADERPGASEKEGAPVAEKPDLLAPILSALGTRLAASAITQLADPKTATTAIEFAYDLMPLPVKLALPKKEFIEFCLRHREPLLQELQRRQAAQPSPA